MAGHFEFTGHDVPPPKETTLGMQVYRQWVSEQGCEVVKSEPCTTHARLNQNTADAAFTCNDFNSEV